MRLNTKQPFRWKFNQSLKQLSVLPPTLIDYKKICSIANLFDGNIRKFVAKKHALFAHNAQTV